jgi:ABC-2 type transport system ATP-binding protein
MTAVECHDLKRSFGSFEAVKGLSFEVQEGEFFAFLGPNGAGKTTTLHMLTTMLLPSSGDAKILGFDVLQQPRRVRAVIGMVFQEPALDERLSARENLEIHAALYHMPRAKLKEQLQGALEWASLEEAGRRVLRTFSGGMKRRLELARALMHDPQVLFLDEPTVGLDPQGRRDLWERIETLRERGLTIFMTTHILYEAEACDRVGIINDGQLVALGSPAELKAKVFGDSEATLEDVFLELTGRGLRDEEATGRERMLGFAKRGGEHTK